MKICLSGLTGCSTITFKASISKLKYKGLVVFVKMATMLFLAALGRIAHTSISTYFSWGVKRESLPDMTESNGIHLTQSFHTVNDELRVFLVKGSAPGITKTRSVHNLQAQWPHVHLINSGSRSLTDFWFFKSFSNSKFESHSFCQQLLPAHAASR